MPGLARKLLIFAAVDGLILQPSPPRSHKSAPEHAIKLDYGKSNAITSLLKSRRDEEHESQGIEVYGIIGLLKISTSSFLISISNREQVAQIRGKPVYTVTDVALIPLSNQSDAAKAIAIARDTVRRHSIAQNEDDSSDSDVLDDYDGRSSVEGSLPGTPPTEPAGPAEELDSDHRPERTSSVAQDVIRKKGMYGRFADRWFSRKGWNDEGRRRAGISREEDLTKKQSQAIELSIVHANKPLPDDGSEEQESSDNTTKELKGKLEKEFPIGNEENDNAIMALLPKILRTTKLYFGSKSFFFSYDYDLSRALGHQSDANAVPLYKSFDPLFFWNHHIIHPFIQANQQGFILPLMQGFVGQRAFSVKVKPSEDETEDTTTEDGPMSPSIQQAEAPVTPPDLQKDFFLTLISRRSVKRAGLRYLRRGVDDEGNVANSVETEQILSSQDWDPKEKIYSFTQCRGSIPLFFSQTPYSFKPVPIFYGSESTNLTAFRKHFDTLSARYGDIYAISLVDKHGTEVTLGELYEKYAKILNDKGGITGKGDKLSFEWFDFHHVCRGMKFENISILIDTLSASLSSYDWTVEQNNNILSSQTGVLRINCMDCLDRTNVVQSAAARDALEKQLGRENCTIDLVKDPSTSWFNTLWADNGDAISRQYAGTAALKGDFTRTRQRNITGALTDFSLTLSRYYNNIINDYFAQAVIDYLLGRVTTQIFDEFEADMTAKDYAIDLRRVRQNAIDACVNIVIEDSSEDFLTGWTLSAPAKSDTLRSLPFEECVLLLTDQALYFCRFDWATEKVRSFERVELERLKGIRKGTYVTSTLGERHMDERKNVGFVISYDASGPGEGLVRTNTRSMANKKEENEVPEVDATVSEQDHAQSSTDEQGAAKSVGSPAVTKSKTKGETRFWAFKALPPRTSTSQGNEEPEAQQPQNEMDVVNAICDEIRNRASKAGFIPRKDGQELSVENSDIISLADAKRQTGYLESLGYAVKKLVWS